jgi:hypothetical protein
MAIVLVVVPATVALGSRIEVGGAQLLQYAGSDGFGKVTFEYSVIPQLHRHPVTDTVTIDRFRFANECSRAGSKVPRTIRVGRDKHFVHRVPGFVVTGRLIGGIRGGAHTAGPKVTGTVQTIGDCDGDSDLVQFTAPAPSNGH